MTTDMSKIYNLHDLQFLQNQNLKIGILGGSFNPAHAGHLHISLEALKHFHLDYVIWLVALQNSFKVNYECDIFRRAQVAADIASGHRILVSTAEHDLNIKYTYQILKYFVEHFKTIEFTWLMGADCLEHFHLWEYSNLIPSLCKITVFDRPGFSNLLDNSEFSSRFGRNNNMISYRGHTIDISSTEIRTQGDAKYRKT
jgi:nicotinate-nucleotide adenylyltransferase